MNYINKLQNDLMKEKEHSAFLEKLLKTLYGDGWEKLTLYEAGKWHRRHLTRNSSGRAEACGCKDQIGYNFCGNCGGRVE